MKQSPVVVLTGGPTRAYLDKVRFLSNVSTGAVAFELAKALMREGFRVVAITGPSSLPFGDLPLQQWVPVETNDEMEKAVLAACRKHKPIAAVFSAAVLDFAPVKVSEGKRASDDEWELRLKPTRKIIDLVGAKFPKIYRVGFKLQWKRDKVEEAAMLKKYFGEKKLNALLVNYLSQIKKGEHPAKLFFPGGDFIPCFGKPDIARTIAEFLAMALNE